MESQDTTIGRGMFGYKPKAVERVLADRAAMLSLAAQRAQAAEARAAELEGAAAQVAELQAAVAARDAVIAQVRAEAASKDEALASQLAAKDEAVAQQLTAKDEALASQLAARDEALAAQITAKDEALGAQQAAQQANEQALRTQIAELEERVEREATNRDVLAQELMRELGPIIAAAEESARRITEHANVESGHRIAEANRTSSEAQANLARVTAWRDQLGGIIESVHASVNDAQAQIADMPQRISDAIRPVVEVMDVVSRSMSQLAGTELPQRVVVEPQLPEAAQAPAAEPAQPVATATEQDAQDQEPTYQESVEPENGYQETYSPEETYQPENTYSPENTYEPEGAYQESYEEAPAAEQPDWTVPAHWTQEQQ